MPVAYQPDGLQYVYAVVPAGSGRPGDEGVQGGRVGAIRYGPLAALTSPVETERIRPSRANLSAHQQVVGSAHRAGPALPVRFGTVMPGEAAVVGELLEPGRRQFEDMLAHFEGKDGYRVKCRYLADVALREVVEGSRAIQRLRAKVAAAGSAAGQGDQVRLGELVFAGLERLRYRDSENVRGALAPHILAWEPLEDGADEVAVHGAVLVERTAAPGLEEALERLADTESGRMAVELIGPLPLWDFTQAAPGAG